MSELKKKKEKRKILLEGERVKGGGFINKRLINDAKEENHWWGLLF